MFYIFGYLVMYQMLLIFNMTLNKIEKTRVNFVGDKMKVSSIDRNSLFSRQRYIFIFVLISN